MYFTEREKEKMMYLYNILQAGNKFEIVLQDGTTLITIFDTSSETDNGLEINEEGYEEFHGYIFKIIEIIQNNKKISSYYYDGYNSDGYNLAEKSHKQWILMPGSLLEITYHNYPKKIEIID